MEKSRILIVEDDLDLSDMICSYFRVQNFDVQAAAWGEEALQLANTHNFDLIMLDIRLPDIDGFELCRHLRSNRKTQDTPIVFLTERRDRLDKLQGLELGVVDYITKPFDIQELRLRVRNAISRAQAPAPLNSVTDLPEGDVVDDRMRQHITHEAWAVLQVTLNRLSSFRERYGFVATDDVLRAVTLMVRNAVREFGAADDYIGHLSTSAFVILTNPAAVQEIRERIERRVEQSREYFFPLRDRERAKEAGTDRHLSIGALALTHESGIHSLDELKARLKQAVRTDTMETPRIETTEPAVVQAVESVVKETPAAAPVAESTEAPQPAAETPAAAPIAESTATPQPTAETSAAAAPVVESTDTPQPTAETPAAAEPVAESTETPQPAAETPAAESDEPLAASNGAHRKHKSRSKKPKTPPSA